MRLKLGDKAQTVILTLSFNFWTFLGNHTNTYAYSLHGDRGFVGEA